MTKYAENLNLMEQNIVKPKNWIFTQSEYDVFECNPATGIVYLSRDNRYFISGHVRMRGEPNGAYPHFYDEMIDNLFGADKNTLEVCSYKYKRKGVTTVDINEDYDPDFVCDATALICFPGKRFSRWRADPPYSEMTAKKMYNCTCPKPMDLLTMAYNVLEPKSLLFLLLGPVNYQAHPVGIKRIGMIIISVVPNNELRCLNIYIKL